MQSSKGLFGRYAGYGRNGNTYHPGGTIPNGGFSFQLNAYNPDSNPTKDTTTTIDWMQYVFAIYDNAIHYIVQYWDVAAACACCCTATPALCPGGGCNCVGPIVNLQDTVLSLPSNTLPKGYSLEIELLNDDHGAGINITGALFSVTDNTGKTTSKLATLDDYEQQLGFPVFEANVVGPDNGSASQFTPGLGGIAVITYIRWTSRTTSFRYVPEGGLPDTACGTPGGKFILTAEKSNVAYSTVGYPCCNVEQVNRSVNT